MTQAADKNVDASLKRIGRTPLSEVDKLVAPQNASGPLAEHDQQIKFRSGQGNARSLGILKMSGMPVEPPAFAERLLVPLHPPAIKLTASQLDALAGEYRDASGRPVVTLFRQGELLYEKNQQGELFELAAESTSSLFYPNGTSLTRLARITDLLKSAPAPCDAAAFASMSTRTMSTASASAASGVSLRPDAAGNVGNTNSPNVVGSVENADIVRHRLAPSP